MKRPQLQARRLPLSATSQRGAWTTFTRGCVALLCCVWLGGQVLNRAHAEGPSASEGPLASLPAGADKLAPLVPPLPLKEHALPEPALQEPTVAAAASSIPTASLLEIIRKGGWMMFPILGCSVILLVFVLERGIMLRGGRVMPRHFVKRFMHQLREGQLDRERALQICQEANNPVAEVFAHGVRKWGRPAVEVEQAVLDGGERLANQLRRHLRILNGVATISPLMGLLGTVTGMIAAFNSISSSQAMGRPELLASGISEALLTTAAGLTVAIPALFFHMFFVGRVDGLIIEIDTLGQDIVHLISAEAPPLPVASKAKPKGKAAASASAAA